MNKHFVSVIIPNYNCTQWLLEAIESVEMQPYNEYEIIVVDDASTNKETDKILEIISSKQKVKVFKLQENKGVGYARNYGIEKSNGDIILTLDCDNKISEQYITIAVDILANNKSVKIVYADAIVFGMVNYVWKTKDFDLKELLIKNYIDACSFFRKKDFLETNGFDQNLPGLLDWDLWISLLENGGIGYHIKSPMFYYRRHENSAISKLNKNPEFLESIRKKIVFKHLKFYSEVLGDPRTLYLENKRLQNKIKQIEASKSYKIINFVKRLLKNETQYNNRK